MKTVVLYHAHCWDGFCAAWIARSVLGKDTECIPVQYGQEPPTEAQDKDARLYVLDFSYPRNVMFQLAAFRHEPMFVLDHHKTAQQALDGLELELGSNNCGNALQVVFNMDKSGGRLTWEHFYETRLYQTEKRSRPWLVDYTEDRDLWLWKLPHSREINAYIRSFPLDFYLWDKFDYFPAHSKQWIEWVGQGEAILRREQQIIDDHVQHAREMEMDGHQILIVNATVLFSDIAGELAKDRPFGACYFDRADGMRQWSLRSTDGGVDVAEIAKRHGGGGHRNAAGYQGIMDEQVVKSRVEGRRAANELSELYVTESARLKNEHGLEAALAFLETLRDNLIAIRPLPVEAKPMPVASPSKARHGRGWDERDIPDRYVLVTFDADCEAETELAVLIGDNWIPKSQLFEVPRIGDYIQDWPVTEWFADKEGLQ